MDDTDKDLLMAGSNKAVERMRSSNIDGNGESMYELLVEQKEPMSFTYPRLGEGEDDFVD